MDDPQWGRGPVVHKELSERIPRGPVPEAVATENVATVDAGFAATSLAAADAARDAARRAFELEALAYRDPLTGLWNRRAYDDRMHDLADAGSFPVAALMLDVDSFKGINDTHGHEAGDRALIGVGRAILQSIRPDDFAARFGGDEFVVLLPGLDGDGAEQLAERIRAAVESRTEEPAITVSVGVAELGEDTRATSLSVDGALYRAKEAGRNRVARAAV
jgi:diguanylate cyclase